MGAFPRAALQAAVAAVCPDIQTRIDSCSAELIERQLWWELCCCVLSSQVPFALAAAAASRIDCSGVFLGTAEHDVDHVRSLVEGMLRKPLIVNGVERRYRFPGARADQLARGWLVIRERRGSLREIVADRQAPATARAWLVANVPGLGPKQASMFLRNVGVSYELAILDRHVLAYMSVVGLCDAVPKPIVSLAAYERHERSLRLHAKEIGYSVGLVDWAIWIVMRAASELSVDGATP